VLARSLHQWHNAAMHAYAIDLESFVFSGAPAYAGLSVEERKARDAGAIVDHVERLLALLREHDTSLTFFVIGEIYEWYPELIHKIRDAGHEIGWHTHTHAYLERPGLLEQELEKSASFIEEFAIRGFQAPAIVMQRDDYHLLKEAGFTYSSSVYSSRKAFEVDGILEIPVSARCRKGEGMDIAYPASMSMGRVLRELPFGSSLFLKPLGWKRISKYIREYEQQGRSANLFMHNWQLFEEPAQARSDRRRECFRNPLAIPYNFKVLNAFTQLLKTHRFGRMDQLVVQEKKRG
jgi:peptidoglycan/xylan/chitin deacetylase (PgdA/CDA1 family)